MKTEVEFNGQKYFIFKPNAKVEREAKLYQSVYFGELIDKGVPTRDSLKGKFRRDEKKSEALKEEISFLLSKLARGGYPKFDARADAIKVYKLRIDFLGELQNSANDYTAESLADEAYDNYVISECVKKETGEKLFSSADDYADKAKTDYAVFLKAEFDKLMQTTSVLDSLEEIKFLKKYGYMNDKFEYVNEAGEVVDEDYKIIPKEDFVEFT